MANTVFITGATGLLGRIVFDSFVNAGWTTVGAGLSRAKPPSILKVDLEDQAAIETTLDDIKYALL